MRRIALKMIITIPLKKGLLLSLLLFGLFYSTSSVNAQTKSYAFQTMMPPQSQQVEVVDSTFFGTYTNESGFTYVFNQDGIFSKSTLLLYISEKMVRDSSKYEVRNNYLFGVIENDSVWCELKDGFYYYGLKELILIHGKGTTTRLLKEGNNYYLNYLEDQMYIPTRFSFNGKQIKVSQFDYAFETTAFDGIKRFSKQEQTDVTLYLLNPTKSEWEALNTSEIFSENEVFYFVK